MMGARCQAGREQARAGRSVELVREHAAVAPPDALADCFLVDGGDLSDDAVLAVLLVATCNIVSV